LSLLSRHRNLLRSAPRLIPLAAAASRSSAACLRRAGALDDSLPAATSSTGHALSNARRFSPAAAASWSATSCRSCVWRIADSGEISNSPHTGQEFSDLLFGARSKLIGRRTASICFLTRLYDWPIKGLGASESHQISPWCVLRNCT